MNNTEIPVMKLLKWHLEEAKYIYSSWVNSEQSITDLAECTLSCVLVTGKRAGLLLWNAYVNVLGKQLCTDGKWWSCNFGVRVRGALRGLLFRTWRGWNNYYEKKIRIWSFVMRALKLRQNVWGCGLTSCSSRQEVMVCFCEISNELLGCVGARVFLDQLSDY